MTDPDHDEALAHIGRAEAMARIKTAVASRRLGVRRDARHRMSTESEEEQFATVAALKLTDLECLLELANAYLQGLIDASEVMVMKAERST